MIFFLEIRKTVSIFVPDMAEKEKTRHFGGKLFVPKDGKERTIENRIEKRVEAKHLKSYLRGDKRYHHPSFGYNDLGPVYKPVHEIWK